MVTMPLAMPMEAMHIAIPIAAISNCLQQQLLIAALPTEVNYSRARNNSWSLVIF